MQKFIDRVAACKIDEAEDVWNMLVEFAAERGFQHLVYGMKSAGDIPETTSAYEATHKDWLDSFVSKGQQHYCYLSIKGLSASSPFMGGLEYLPEPWADTKAYVDVAKFAFDCGLKRTLAIPLTIYTSPTGLSGIAFHSDLPKEQFEANVKKYQSELMAAALFANDWLKPWVGKKLKAIKAPEFTKRQTQVFEMLALGKTNKEIAYHMKISAPTVSFHIKEIMMRLGANTSREIISKATAIGLIL